MLNALLPNKLEYFPWQVFSALSQFLAILGCITPRFSPSKQESPTDTYATIHPSRKYKRRIISYHYEGPKYRLAVF
jgi:hypothetical protein